jgi:hypothetical protein
MSSMDKPERSSARLCRTDRRGEHQDRVVAPDVDVVDSSARGQPVVGNGSLGRNQHCARGI